MGKLTVTEDALGELKNKVLGEVICQGDSQFEAARNSCTFSTPWTEDKTPAMIVRPRGTLDVVTAVKFAKEQGMPLAVRGGGHSVAALGLAKAGLTLDLGLMRGVFVDPVERTVTAQGGCLLSDIDSETSLFKLAVPMGHAPITGLGLAINGGIGVACRTLNSTCRNILSMQIVTAEGEVVTADKDNHADLFWALCGAGSAFGVATKITFQLHDVSSFFGGLLMWKDDPEHNNFRTIAKFMRDVGHKEHNFSMNLIWGCHPEIGTILLSMVSFLGDDRTAEEKREFMKPVLELPALQNTIGSSSYYDMQNSLTPLLKDFPPTFYEYWTNGTASLEEMTDDTVEQFVSMIDSIPIEKAPMTMLLYDMWGGKMKNAPGPLGYTNDFAFFLVLIWLDAQYGEEMRTFAQQAKAKLARSTDFSLETYGNAAYVEVQQTGPDADAKIAKRVGGAENLARLRELKAAWDPDNMFRSHPFAGL